MRNLLLACACLIGLAAAAYATSGPGCLVVVNVASDDALNLRAKPSADAEVVDVLVPGQHGIIHLDGACRPAGQPWARRW